MQIRTIPMEQWCALARENVAPPVTICLEGESMRPLIRKGRDPVTIVPVRGEMKKGDVVLFTLGDGRYVVHRVWRLREGLVRTLGDNCVNPGAMVPEGTGARGRWFGSAGTDTRSGWIRPRRGAFGRVWMALFPIGRGYKRARTMAGRAGV